jgi:transcriptional regulator with XRE-family HTH domain
MTARDVADCAWACDAATAQQIKQALAHSVRRERERAGLSQLALASISQIPRGTISRNENAETEPRISTLLALANALGVPLQVFLDGLPQIVERREGLQAQPAG